MDMITSIEVKVVFGKDKHKIVFRFYAGKKLVEVKETPVLNTGDTATIVWSKIGE